VRNAAMGAVKGAANIGATLLAPADAIYNVAQRATGGQSMSPRRERIREFFAENADPESMSFKVGELGAEIAGTAGAPVALGKMLANTAASKFAPVVSSSGFNLGPAATNSALGNALIRAGGGAVGGGMQAGMVDPSSADTGSMIGAATPGVVQAAGKAGNLVRSGLESGANRLMQSALKPTIEQLRSGKAETARQVLLAEGLNPTRAGADALKSRIDDLNSDIKSRIASSGATVDRQAVADALRDTEKFFTNQVSPTADLNAINSVRQDFMAHPGIARNNIPVQLAQELKQGTYKVLGKKYGQLGTAETEAQKGLARGLKEQIAQVVPEVGPLNARESHLLDALDVVERRVLMDANKNPLGLAALASNPVSWAAFMADKSALFKSLVARMLNQTASVNVPQALPNLVKQHGLLGAPALIANSSP